MRLLPILILSLSLGFAGFLPGVQAVDPLGEVLAREDSDHWLATDLRRVLSDLPPAGRAEALKVIGATRRASLADETAAWVDDGNPVVAIAAIDALIALWPTSAEHAALVRAKLLSPLEDVPEAAIRFALHVGDDRAIPDLARRLQREPTDESTRNALRRLSGQDFPDGGGWLGWYDERVATLAPLLAQAQGEVVSPDSALATRAVQRLMGIKEQQSSVGEIVLVAATHPAPQVRDMAHTALRLIGGPVAGCAQASFPLPLGTRADVVAIPAPGTDPVPVQAHLALADNALGAAIVFLALIALLAACVFALRRPPAPGAAPLSTRIIRRMKRTTWLS